MKMIKSEHKKVVQSSLFYKMVYILYTKKLQNFAMTPKNDYSIIFYEIA